MARMNGRKTNTLHGATTPAVLTSFIRERVSGAEARGVAAGSRGCRVERELNIYLILSIWILSDLYLDTSREMGVMGSSYEKYETHATIFRGHLWCLSSQRAGLLVVHPDIDQTRTPTTMRNPVLDVTRRGRVHGTDNPAIIPGCCTIWVYATGPW